MVANTLLPVGRVLDTQSRQSEHIIAIPNQTVFTLLTALYEPGFNTLDVYVNGLKKEVTVDFTETSTSIVTFLLPMFGGESLEFVSNIILNNGVAYRNLHTFVGATPLATQATVTQAVATAMSQPTLRPSTGTAGLVQVFGNNGGWKYATGGGSRLFLGKVDPLNTVTPFTYQFIDMSDSAHLSFDVNLDTLPVGVVFASYLVPMKVNMTTSLSLPVIGNTVLNAGITANPSLADEWGIGYGDAQGVNTIYTPEVDVFEASGIGAQVTLHGYDRSVGQTGLGGIDNPGVWSSVHGLSGTTQFPAANVSPSGTYDPMTFGPGTQFLINTQQSMHIDATFIGPKNVAGVADTLSMTVVISQGVNSITQTVTSVGFTVADLQKMVYTSSIWATDTVVSATDTTQTSNTWWLDGVADHTTNATTDQRGWGLPAGIVPTDGTLPVPAPAIVPTGILNPMFTDYNAYSTQMSFYIKKQDITNAANQRPVCARTGNLQFDMVDTLGNAIVAGTTMAWTLDVKYRGVVNLGAPYNHINFWSGRYNASYGVYTQDVADTITSTPTLTTGLIPSMLPSDPLPPVFTAYSAGIGSNATSAVVPPAIASLTALISTASGATYLESIANVVIPTATATVPWNVIPADNIGLQTYSNVGITNTQAAGIVTATAHSALLNNPHQVTKAQVGLGLVPNTDFTSAVNLNTAKVGITSAQTSAIVANTAKVSDINHVAALLPNVNNTSDLAKPISAATQTALNAKLDSIAMTKLIGNIQSPLVHIPFKRSNDAVALSGVQTFSRPSVGFYEDSLGGFNTAAIDAPRFELMPDGEIGLALMRGSTNIYPNSDTFTPIQTVAPASAVSNAVGLLGAANTATTLTLTNTNAYDVFSQITGLTVGATYTLSFYVKLGTATNLTFTCNDTTTWNTLPSTHANISAAQGYSTTGYKRVERSFVATASGAINLHLGSIPEITLVGLQTAGTVFVTGFQLEVQEFATPLIQTGAVAVTRPPETLSFPILGNMTHSFTFIADVSFKFLSQYNAIFETRLGSTSTPVMLALKNGSVGNNALILNSPSGAIVTNTVYRIANVQTPTEKSIYINGVLAVTIANGTNTLDPVGVVTLGAMLGTLMGLDGHIRNLRIYDKGLTALEVAMS